ncbi:substrate-binding domain-containing protein [Nitrincola sp. A-D6]|uniref:substrate-binding domain-containing protein n=1 Tax=Nitrincola sp. A-D6 TaxID=1545442 RepID=UPI00068D7B71|nr:substrate-binding domain-containing protein [Nitrincola sp. A-D6]
MLFFRRVSASLRFNYLAVCLLSLLLSSSLSASELRVSGASTIFPIINQLSTTLENRNALVLQLSAGGSGRGISDVREGVSDLGMVSRALRADEKADLQYTTIALDTLVFIVNESNPQTTITRQELIDLFTRQRDWQEINGFDWPVRLVSKEVGRSTLDLFEDFTGLNSPDRSGSTGRLISADATIIGSNLESLTLVGGQQGGVGYVSLGAAESMRDQGLPVRILDLAGITPSAQTINNGQYPIRRELNLVYQTLTPEIEALLRLLQSTDGKQVVESEGFVATGGQQ